MPLPRNKAWFAAKTFGWGWGLPLRWQGWTVLLLFIAAVIGGAPLVKKSPVIFVVYSGALGAVLLGFCWWKGEPPKWRWGSRE